MKRHFYSELIEIEELTVELDGLDLSDSERKHLASLADDSLHNAILDAILQKLPESERRKLMDHIAIEKHDKVWEILHENIEEIDSLIKDTAKEVKDNLRKDVKEAKKLK